MIGICSALLAGSLAFAGSSQHQKLLDCNTPIGPDQQVIVTQNGSEYFLEELDTAGRSQQRVLSAEELKSGGIKLATTKDGTVTTLRATPQGWWLESINEGTGYKESAAADCIQ